MWIVLDEDRNVRVDNSLTRKPDTELILLVLFSISPERRQVLLCWGKSNFSDILPWFSLIKFWVLLPESEKCKLLSCVQLFATPWNSPGQNTGVGSVSLLQGIFPTQGSHPGLPHCRQLLQPQGKPKNTGVGSLSLPQWNFPTQESNQGLLQLLMCWIISPCLSCWC